MRGRVVAVLLCVSACLVPAIGRAEPASPYMWCNLQWPMSMTMNSGPISDMIYGRMYIEGVTPNPGLTPGLVAEVGYGPDGSDPTLDGGGWSWQPAAFNWDVGDHDEFMATLTVRSPAGTYDYAYRYSYLGGPWIYGDTDGNSNNGYDTYSPSMAGSLFLEFPTGILEESPLAWRLDANHPNPFNPSTTIRFAIPAAVRVRVGVYSLAGQLVARLVDADLGPGAHEAVWTGLDVAGRPAQSGVYVCRMEAGSFSDTRRMTLLK